MLASQALVGRQVYETGDPGRDVEVGPYEVLSEALEVPRPEPAVPAAEEPRRPGVAAVVRTRPTSTT